VFDSGEFVELVFEVFCESDEVEVNFLNPRLHIHNPNKIFNLHRLSFLLHIFLILLRHNLSLLFDNPYIYNDQRVRGTRHNNPVKVEGLPYLMLPKRLILQCESYQELKILLHL